MSLTMSARDFNQDVARAKRAAAEAPVIITDRGTPAFVLMSIEQYHARDVTGQALIDLLFMPEDVDVQIDESVFEQERGEQALRDVSW